MRPYLINLDRRTDRLESATREFASKTDLHPERWRAVDGSLQPLPPGWTAGHGALGCSLSHRGLLRHLLDQGVEEAAMVFEDDVVFDRRFREKWPAFLAKVPADWDAIFIGGQHETHPTPVCPGVVKCHRTGRTHAYVLRGRYMRYVLDGWDQHRGHIDHWWRENQSTWNVYAPEVFLCGQGASRSDINNRPQRERWWTVGPRSRPVKERVPREDRPYPRKVRGPRVEPSTTASHFGDLGDTIYALPIMRRLGISDLVLYPGPGRVREPYTADKVERVASFFQGQPLRVRYQERPEGVVLDQWRRRYQRRMNLSDMVASYFHVQPWPHDQPWAVVDEPRKVAKYVLHRSPRYHGDGTFPWKEIVERVGKEAVFVGSVDEHVAFCGAFGDVPYFETPTLLDLARTLAGAEWFVGNQSTPRAVAESLKKNVWVEECTRTPNTRFARSGAHYATTFPTSF
jgi:hypothetical protein